MSRVVRVNDHVAYLQQTTVGADPLFVKRRPATVTALAGGTNVDLRVLHGGEVYLNVPKRTDPNANTVGTYVTY